jgi:hypothetical protein
LTDNDIQVLGNFPLSPRVRTLLLARNRIAAVQATLPAAVPNLRNLVLAGNSLGELADLDVLGRFARLTHLVLVDNPVAKKEVRLLCLTEGQKECVGWEFADRGYSIIGTGSSGGVPPSAFSTTKRSRMPSGQRRKSCLARPRRRLSWLRR